MVVGEKAVKQQLAFVDKWQANYDIWVEMYNREHVDLCLQQAYQHEERKGSKTPGGRYKFLDGWMSRGWDRSGGKVKPADRTGKTLPSACYVLNAEFEFRSPMLGKDGHPVRYKFPYGGYQKSGKWEGQRCEEYWSFKREWKEADDLPAVVLVGRRCRTPFTSLWVDVPRGQNPEDHPRFNDDIRPGILEAVDRLAALSRKFRWEQ